MKKSILFLGIGVFVCSASMAQINLNNAVNSVTNNINSAVNSAGGQLSNDDAIKGLKEALDVGAKNSASKASAADGFYKNAAIKIPFPPEAQKIKSTVESIGMKKEVDKFVMSLNRAAEEAAKEAAPIFLSAIKQMSVTDGINIVKGADNAATKYLQDKTTAQLKTQFSPIVKKALQKVEVTKHWNPIIKKYNKIPGVKKMNPNLEEYVTQKAIEGLFKLIAEEELKIRKDPAARVSDILKKVFGMN